MNSATGSMWTTFIMFGAIILIFYFLIIRPQKKRDKETQAMLDALKKGDKIITIGGIHGTVVAVKEKTVVIKVDDNARIEFLKSAVSTVVNKDAAKAAPAKKKEAKAEEAKPTSVMATWMVARNWPESEERSRALLARLSPSSASGSSTALLALTTAISEAEK